MKLKFLIPFAIFVVLAGFLFKGLYLDPRAIPSVLVNKPMPVWTLPVLTDPARTVSVQDMKGRVWMLNVFATWCQPCKIEHPFMVSLKRNGLKTPLVGFVYKDDPSSVIRMLRRNGNPYDTVVYEMKNRVGIDLGITGVPETFIIDKKGVIRAKVSRLIDEALWNDTIRPLIDKLEAE